jgi:hypothetical protein
MIGHSAGMMVSWMVIHEAGDRTGQEKKEDQHMKRINLIRLIMIVAMLSALVTSAHGQARSGSQSEVVAAEFSAEITGTVKSVNPRSGKLVLETVEGPVNVKFPSDAVQGIKQGDIVTVSVGLVKPPPSASPQTAPKPK